MLGGSSQFLYSRFQSGFLLDIFFQYKFYINVINIIMTNSRKFIIIIYSVLQTLKP